jgi:hypothetical protein
MSKYLRLAALFSCLGLLVLGTVALDPNGPLLSSFRGCSARRTSLMEAVEERERLTRFEEATFRRNNTKLQIAEEVIAQRLSLAEAMAQFRALDQQWPQFDLSRTKAERAMSEDEWDGRGVIVTVWVVLKHRPDEAAAVVARLQKELQELLADPKKLPTAPVEARIEPSR